MRITALFAAIALFAAGSVEAQQQVPVGQLPATTVQLPSFSFFSVRTTVSVPDGGGAYLGGINRGRDSSSRRGLGNRAIGSDRNAGGVMVRAQIHDMDELDKAVLADAAGRRGPIDPELAKAELIRRGVGQGGADQGVPDAADHDIGPDSVAVIRAKNAAAAESRKRSRRVLRQSRGCPGRGQDRYCEDLLQNGVKPGRWRTQAACRIASGGARSQKSGRRCQRRDCALIAEAGCFRHAIGMPTLRRSAIPRQYWSPAEPGPNSDSGC